MFVANRIRSTIEGATDDIEFLTLQFFQQQKNLIVFKFTSDSIYLLSSANTQKSVKIDRFIAKVATVPNCSKSILLVLCLKPN